MANRYEAASDSIRKDSPDHTAGTQRVDKYVASLVKRGFLPKTLEGEATISETQGRNEVSPKLDLEAIVVRQVERYLQLGFHKEVYPGLDEKEAKAKYQADFTLPEGASQPEVYRGRFDVVLAVEPRISLTRKHELAKRMKELNLDSVARNWRTSQVAEWIDTGKIEDLTDYPKDTPYLIFTHDGQKYRPYSVAKALTFFAADEVGNPQVEVTDLFLQNPQYYIGRGIEAAGSRTGHGSFPYLDAFVGRPGVDADSPGHQGQGWGALSRGKVPIRLGA